MTLYICLCLSSTSAGGFFGMQDKLQLTAVTCSVIWMFVLIAQGHSDFSATLLTHVASQKTAIPGFPGGLNKQSSRILVIVCLVLCKAYITYHIHIILAIRAKYLNALSIKIYIYLKDFLKLCMPFNKDLLEILHNASCLTGRLLYLRVHRFLQG